MQPSSLVLVAIVGMWAAYLVPSWIRRGEHRIARRQADKIAEDARVLEPRTGAPAEAEGPSTAPLLRRPVDSVTARIEDAPSDVSVSAEVRADVDSVRLAELMHDPHRSLEADAEVRGVADGRVPPDLGSRILRRARAGLPPDSASPEAGPTRRPALAGTPSTRPSTSASQPVVEAPAAPVRRRPAPAVEPPPRVSPAEVDAYRRAAADAARRRSRLLVVLIGVTVGSWGVVALPQVSSLAALPGTMLLGLDVLLLVATAPARARRREAMLGGRVDSSAPERPAAVTGPVASHSAAAARRRSAALYDVDAAAAASSQVAPAEPVQQPDDGTWVPVPVPPPTYTMKPVVHRHEPLVIEPIDALPAADAGVSLGRAAEVVVDEQPADEPDVEFDLDAVLARRRAVNG